MDVQGTIQETNHLEDEIAFKSIFDAHYQRLVLFADSFIWNTAAAEDIVQTVFTELWQQGTWKDRTLATQPYLYKAVKNRCLNEIRNQNVRDSHNLRYVQAMLNVWEDGDDSQALLEELKKCICNLPEQVRRTIELRYFHGKSVSETAGILNVSENTVKTQIKRGRATLKLSLSEVRLKIFLLLVTLLAD
jgi:RNA polymerase sigma-70 factor, ECF subfamily